jgi:phosphomannomutase
MSMKKGDISFGGEYSGHVFFRDKWPGFDDGLYAGFRFLEMRSKTDLKVSEILASIDKYATSAYEIKAGENGKREVVERIKEYAHSRGYETIELDGVRMEFDLGWSLVRFSNTSPNVTVFFEANNKENLVKIEDEIFTLVKQYISEAKE